MNRFAGLARILILSILLAALLAAVILWLSLPRLLSVAPQDGAAGVPAHSPLRLEFSRPMQPESVQARLAIEPALSGQFAWDGNTLIFTPDDAWPAGETVRVALRPGAVSPGALALPLQGEHAWSFTVRQPRLVFLFPANGPANLYLRDLPAGANQFLTNILAGVQDYSVSSGGKIVFSAFDPQGGADLYLLDGAIPGAGPEGASVAAPDGATPAAALQPRLLLSCAPGTCRQPSLSPDERFLAYERSDAPAPGQVSPSQVWIAPLDNPSAAVPVSDLAHTGALPSWSPHGRLTYYDQDAQAFVVVLPGQGEEARFPNETGQPGSWRPGGEGFVAPEIGFLDANVSRALQDLERLANSHLMLYPWPQAGPLDLSQEESLEDAVPVFSPDGAQIVFARKYLDTRRWSPGRQMWLMDVDTRQARALTDDPDYNHFDFAWSPDGRRLAYVRFNQSLLTEPPEVWVMDLQTGERRLLISGGYSPQWIP